MSCFLLTCLEMFVKMLCESLHKEIYDFPLYSGRFAENFVCNPESELCMLGNCKSVQNAPACCKKQGQVQETLMSMQHGISGSMWNKIMVQAKKGKSMKRVKKIQKVLKEGTVDDLLEDLEVQLPSFLEHLFVK